MTPPPPKIYFLVAEPIPPGAATSKTVIPPHHANTLLSPSNLIQYSIAIKYTVETPSLATPNLPTNISIMTTTPVPTVETQSSPPFAIHITISGNPHITVETPNTSQSPYINTFLTPVHTVKRIPNTMASPGPPVETPYNFKPSHHDTMPPFTPVQITRAQSLLSPTASQFKPSTAFTPRRLR